MACISLQEELATRCTYYTLSQDCLKSRFRRMVHRNATNQQWHAVQFCEMWEGWIHEEILHML